MWTRNAVEPARWMGAAALLLHACTAPVAAPASGAVYTTSSSNAWFADASAENTQSTDASPAGSQVSPGDGSGAVVNPSPGDASMAAPQDCVTSLVQGMRGQMDVCRSCHLPNGLAGRTRFVLGNTPAGDEASVRAAFTALGRDLLAIPAEEGGRSHGGGQVFMPGSADYAAWEKLLAALATPQSGCGDTTH